MKGTEHKINIARLTRQLLRLKRQRQADRIEFDANNPKLLRAFAL